MGYFNPQFNPNNSSRLGRALGCAFLGLCLLQAPQWAEAKPSAKNKDKAAHVQGKAKAKAKAGKTEKSAKGKSSKAETKLTAKRGKSKLPEKVPARAVQAPVSDAARQELAAARLI